jgi:hypothetical protein
VKRVPFIHIEDASIPYVVYHFLHSLHQYFAAGSPSYILAIEPGDCDLSTWNRHQSKAVGLLLDSKIKDPHQMPRHFDCVHNILTGQVKVPDLGMAMLSYLEWLEANGVDYNTETVFVTV